MTLRPDEKRALLAELPPTQDRERRTYPLSFAQQRLWFLDQLAPGNVHLQHPVADRSRGARRTPRSPRASTRCPRGTRSLRTTFAGPRAAGPGGSRRELAAGPARRRPRRHLPPTERGDGGRGCTSPRRSSPSTSRGARSCARPCCGLQPTRARAAPDLHHIVTDGWSLGVLVRELAALYAGARGRPAVAAARAADPVRRLRRLAARAGCRARCWSAQLAYWRERLAGAAAGLELPTDRPRPAVQSYRGACRRFALPPRARAERSQALGRREGATLFMALLAGLPGAARTATPARSDLVVGTPIANRNRAEIEGLIGFFVNTLVLRGDLAGDPTFRELLARVREAALGAYAHQDLPFEKLVEELQPERDLSRNPLFQVVFQLPPSPGSPSRSHRATAGSPRSSSGSRRST